MFKLGMRTRAKCSELRATIALVALGLAMCAFVAVGPWIIRAFDFAAFIPMMAASGAITIMAVRLAPSVPPGVGLTIIFAVAAIARLILLAGPPHLSTDIYRYVWDGRVQAVGINPYSYVPADPALAFLRDAAVYPNINRADYAVTAYPPVAQMFFALVTRICDGIVSMRLALIGCEIIVVATMMRLLRKLGKPPTAVVAWAWHPLAIWEISDSGHVDGLMVALLMLAVWLLVANRALAGALAVALAALVKPYAIVVTPAFWRPWDWRLPLVIFGAIIACYLPYLNVGKGVLGFVTTGYLTEEGFESGAGFWTVAAIRAVIGPIPGLTAAYLLVALAALAGMALRIAFRPERSTQQTLQNVSALLLAGLFVISPNYAWYFLAVVPFIVLGGGAPAWTISLTAILLYRPIILPAHEFTWKTLAFLPFLCAVAWQLSGTRIAALWLGGALSARQPRGRSRHVVW